MEKLPPAKKWIKTILIYAEFGHQHGKEKEKWVFWKMSESTL